MSSGRVKMKEGGQERRFKGKRFSTHDRNCGKN